MKKIFILILLLIFTSPVFAQYKPIPQKYSKEYKEEIEHTIEIQIPISKIEIDNVFTKVEKEQDKYDKELIIEYGIDGVLFDLYWKLIDVTEKYIGKNKIRKFLNEDDNPFTLHYALEPYLKDNKINTSVLYEFIEYSAKKQKELEKKFNYPTLAE